MTILHVHSGSVAGGIERMLATIAAERLGDRTVTHAFAICFDREAAAELKRTGAAVQVLGDVRISNPLSVLRARRRLRAVIEQVNPTAIVSHSPWTQVALGPVIARSGIPFVYYLHEWIKAENRIERLARRTQPHYVVTNSNFTAESVSNLYPRVQHETILYPIGTDTPPADYQRREEIRRKFDTPNDAVVIIQLSRLEPWKGHRLHLAALAQLKETPGWISWIGAGVQRPHEEAYASELRQLAKEYGIEDRVRFLPYIPGPYHVLDSADIHCQPNTGAEPFGIVFVEALMRGLPVVTTNMGGAREIVDASCGVLVEPGHPEKLAEQLRSLILDPELRSRYGNNGPSRASLICDTGRQLAAFERVVGNVVAKCSRN